MYIYVISTTSPLSGPTECHRMLQQAAETAVLRRDTLSSRIRPPCPLQQPVAVLPL